MYVKSVIPIVEARYNSLTQIEKNIAKFFIENKDKMDFSAKSIAKRLFVSEASLSRFAKKCGFNGYREFIFQYKESVESKDEVIENSSIIVLDAYQELLNKTYSLVDNIQISRIVKYLYESKRVVACGKGSSGFVANEMENRFMRIGVDIDSLLDSDRMRMQSVFLDRESLVFGFSISGDTAPVLYLLKEAKAKGVKTVLFTATDNEKFSKYCDEVVLVASLKYLNYGNMISPQYPMLVMLDILYNAYAKQDKNRKDALHGDTIKALKAEENYNRDISL